MKKLLLLLLLSLGFVGSLNADINDNTYIDDDLLLKIKNAGLTYTKKCPMDSNMNTWNECVGQFEDQLGNQYFGDMNFGLPDGYGKYEFISHGNVYAGEFKNGQINGQGFRRSYDGYNSIQGEWKNGLFHGKGIRIFPSGEKYDGEWTNGKHQGQGTFYSSCGGELVGRFKKGMPWNTTDFDKDQNFVGLHIRGLKRNIIHLKPTLPSPLSNPH